MKCSLGISNFLEEISSLYHSIVFLCFFALVAKECFLISPWYLWTLHSEIYIFPFLLCFSLPFFSQLFLRPPQTVILLFCWNSNTLVTWCKELDHWKRLWCWERLRAGGEGDDRGWDGWMASPTQWTWVWVNSGSWWWTGRPGMLWFMGSQRVGQDWVTELNWTDIFISGLHHTLLELIQQIPEWSNFFILSTDDKITFLHCAYILLRKKH